MGRDITWMRQEREYSQEDVRALIFDWERSKEGLPQIELRVEHYFIDGVCARTLYIPAGVEASGRIHLYENLNILSQGEMLVLTERGMQHVYQGFHIVSPPGTKRIVKTLTDCIWTTIIRTDERDPEKIEALLTVNNEQEYLALTGSLTIEGD